MLGLSWSPVARTLLIRKHAIGLLFVLHHAGAATTTELIRHVGGHPAAVIATLREMESLGVLYRSRESSGRHALITRLTVRGMQLVETPICRWDRVLAKWGNGP